MGVAVASGGSGTTCSEREELQPARSRHITQNHRKEYVMVEYSFFIFALCIIAIPIGLTVRSCSYCL